jgi:hypothetical protein
MPEPISATAIIIASLISGGATVGGGIMQNKSAEKANKENLALAHLTRGDTLAAQKSNMKLAKEQLALSKRGQEFNEQEAVLNREENTEQKGYSRLQNSYQRAADLMTKQINMNQIAGAPFQKYAGGK